MRDEKKVSNRASRIKHIDGLSALGRLRAECRAGFSTTGLLPAACVRSARRTTGRRERCCAQGMPLPPRPPVSRRNGPLSLHGRGSGAYQEIAAPRARFPDSPLRRTGAPRDSGAAMPTRTAALLLPAPRPRAITGCGTGAAASAAETALAARARPRAHGCFPCVRPQVDVHTHQALTNSTGPC